MLNRYTLGCSIAYLTLPILLSFLFLQCANVENKPTSKPNVVLINIDDLGWSDLGYMGSEFYSSPNIDWLASQGMRFTNGYATASNCAPSRACMLTSKWSPRHGVYTVSPSARGKAEHRKLIPIKNTKTLDKKFRILPKILKENGYINCHAGKWHLSDDPLQYGFDKNIGGNHAGHPKSYYPPYKNVDLDAPVGKNLTDLVMEKAIEFVNETESPFFLHYTPYAVHTPIQTIDSLRYKYENKTPWQGQSNVDYATMIENVDRNIGDLINALREKDQLDNTIIIFSSDNGGLAGVTFNKPLRAGKGSYYEGGIRVPMIFYWKNNIEANSSSDYPISNLDFLPTLLDALEFEEDMSNYDGHSILNVLRGGEPKLERKLYWHFPFYLQAYQVYKKETRDSLFRTRPGSVIRKGDWKLHHYFEDDGIELYNLKEDIGEKNDLTESHPEKREELYAELNQWRKEINAPIPTELNPEYINRNK